MCGSQQQPPNVQIKQVLDQGVFMLHNVAADHFPRQSQQQPPQSHTTLFFGNINGKIKKSHLKRLLHALCVPFGQILGIVVMRAPGRLIGTAFVAFKEHHSVGMAMNALQGLPFMGRPLRLEPARSKSRARKQFELHVLGSTGVDDDSDARKKTATQESVPAASVQSEDEMDMDVE